MKVVRNFHEDGSLAHELLFDDDRNFVSGRIFFDDCNFFISCGEIKDGFAADWVKEYKETGKCSFDMTIAFDSMALVNL